MKKQNIGIGWDFAAIWNECLHSIPERPLQSRDYIYASELGGSFTDRYLKMYAVTPTNPPNERSKRKFSAGHVFEWIVGLVLTSAGVLKSRQLRGEYQLKGMLSVSGRLDFIAGGQVDWELARNRVQELKSLFLQSNSDMPPIVTHAIDVILERFEAQFRANSLKEVVFECKSVSSFMSDKIDRTGKPMPHHQLQCLHYLLSNEMDEAYLVYCSKDDLFTYQFSVQPTEELLGWYAKDVKQMTEFYNAGFDKKKPLKFAPSKEPEVVFDPETGRFSTNYKIEYSPYLSLLYPEFGSPMSYRMKWDKSVSSWNRVFKRCTNNDKMTPANLDIIKEAKITFPNWDELVDNARKSGVFTNDEENEN